MRAHTCEATYLIERLLEHAEQGRDVMPVVEEMARMRQWPIARLPKKFAVER